MPFSKIVKARCTQLLSNWWWVFIIFLSFTASLHAEEMAFCHSGAEFPDSWKTQADCSEAGCYFGKKSKSECITLANNLSAKQMVWGLPGGGKKNKCWLHNACPDLQSHSDYELTVLDKKEKVQEFPYFHWTSSDNKALADNVIYEFSYQIVTPKPYFIFYALTYDKIFNTTPIGNPIDTTKVKVYIDGIEVEINNSGKSSWNYGNGLFIRLKNPELAKSGANIKVELHGVRNGKDVGEYLWYIVGKHRWNWIRTATGGGHALDQVSNPLPIEIKDNPSIPILHGISLSTAINGKSCALKWDRNSIPSLPDQYWATFDCDASPDFIFIQDDLLFTYINGQRCNLQWDEETLLPNIGKHNYTTKFNCKDTGSNIDINKGILSTHIMGTQCSLAVKSNETNASEYQAVFNCSGENSMLTVFPNNDHPIQERTSLNDGGKTKLVNFDKRTNIGRNNWYNVASGFYEISSRESTQTASLDIADIDLNYILNKEGHKVVFGRNSCRPDSYRMHLLAPSDVQLNMSVKASNLSSAQINISPRLNLTNARSAQNLQHINKTIGVSSHTNYQQKVTGKRDIAWLNINKMKKGHYVVDDLIEQDVVANKLSDGSLELLDIISGTGESLCSNNSHAVLFDGKLIIFLEQDMENLFFAFKGKNPGLHSLKFARLTPPPNTSRRLLKSVFGGPSQDVDSYWADDNFLLNPSCKANINSCKKGYDFVSLGNQKCHSGQKALCIKTSESKYHHFLWLNASVGFECDTTKAMNVCHQGGGDVLGYDDKGGKTITDLERYRLHNISPSMCGKTSMLLCGYKDNVQVLKVPKDSAKLCTKSGGKVIPLQTTMFEDIAHFFAGNQNILCEITVEPNYNLDQAQEGKTWAKTTGELDKNWLYSTPINAFGKAFSKIPKPKTVKLGKNDPSNFGLAECNNHSDCSGTNNSAGQCVKLQSVARKSNHFKAEKRCAGNNYALYEDMYKMIISAEKFIDIATLYSLHSGRWKSSIINALAKVSKTATSPIKLRWVIGEPLKDYQKGPQKFREELAASEVLEKLIAEITTAGGNPDNLDISVSITTSFADDKTNPREMFSGWNHSKILAIDGYQLFTGGHNYWGTYLAGGNGQLLMDVSMKAKGKIAIEAHKFLNYVMEKQQENENNAERKYGKPLNLTRRSNNLNTLLLFDETTDAVNKPVERPVTMYSMGRIGGQQEATHSIDRAIVAMIRNAEKSVWLSLQDLGPIASPFGVNGPQYMSPWPVDVMRELALAIHRGVEIHLFLSGYGEYLRKKEQSNSIVNKITYNFGAYHHGYSLQDNLVKLANIGAGDNRSHHSVMDITKLICKNFHIYETQFNEDITDVPYAKTYGNVIANHAKTMSVDMKKFLISSHNLYDHDLTEFGILVDDPDYAFDYFLNYWQPLQQNSRETCISGKECLKSKKKIKECEAVISQMTFPSKIIY